ncbi:MAG: hypothetical protein U1E83_10250 [Methylotetracoccus sp.]
MTQTETDPTRDTNSIDTPLATLLRSRAVWIGCAILAVWAFPDFLLHLAGTLLHFVIGWIETAVNGLLHHTLGVSHRVGQGIVAWSGVLLGLFGAHYAARRLWAMALSAGEELRQFAATFNERHHVLLSPRVVAACAGVGALIFFFV